jgi:hypothetical protein
MEEGQEIEINEYLPYIAINTTMEEYFFQGEETETFFEEYQELVKRKILLSVSFQEWLLWTAQSW